jgi:hypothetical protein
MIIDGTSNSINSWSKDNNCCAVCMLAHLASAKPKATTTEI